MLTMPDRNYEQQRFRSSVKTHERPAQKAAVCHQILSVDIGRCVAGKKRHHSGDVAGLANSAGRDALNAKPRMDMPGGVAVPQVRDFGRVF